jgi:hypothetical protein
MSGEICVEVEAGGAPRRLFEISQTPETLSLILRSKTTWAPVGGAGVATIKQQKYSVHATLRSENNINIIKRFMRLSNNEKTDSIMKTRSLKQTNSYTPMFFEWCSHLIKPQYDVTSWRKDRIGLGSYNPDKAVLIYGVFVGPEQRVWAPDCYDDILSREIICNSSYRLIVIWSFLNLKSENAGIVNHISSDPPRIFVGDMPATPATKSEFFDGLDELGSINIYRYSRNEFRKAAFNNMFNSGVPAELLNVMFASTKFIRDGH